MTKYNPPKWLKDAHTKYKAEYATQTKISKSPKRSKSPNKKSKRKSPIKKSKRKSPNLKKSKRKSPNLKKSKRKSQIKKPKRSTSQIKKPKRSKSITDNKKDLQDEMTELDNILQIDGNTYKVKSKTAEVLISYNEEGKVVARPRRDHYYEPRQIEPAKLFIHALYKNEAPPGYIRKILCLVLNKIKKERNLLPTDRITLEASGFIDGSFLKLIQMYQRMGFEVDRTYGENAESIYDAILSKSNDYETFKNLSNEDINVLMSQKIENLIEWCDNKY